ncbi:hypothetical protein ACFL04_00135 [Patescibacteria group bacterium]
MEATRAASDRGAQTFVSYPTSQNQLQRSVEVALGRNSLGHVQPFVLPDFDQIKAAEELDDDAIMLLLRGAAMHNLAALVGGVDKFFEIIQRHNAHEHPVRRRELFAHLNNWGELTPGQQVLVAMESYPASGKVRQDPVAATICDIAQEIICGEAVTKNGQQD